MCMYVYVYDVKMWFLAFCWLKVCVITFWDQRHKAVIEHRGLAQDEIANLQSTKVEAHGWILFVGQRRGGEMIQL